MFLKSLISASFVFLLFAPLSRGNVSASGPACIHLQSRDLNLCVNDEVVDLHNVPSEINSRNDYLHGRVIAVKPAEKAITLQHELYISYASDFFANGNSNIVMTDDFPAEMFGVVKIPVSGKYSPGDPYQGAEIFETVIGSVKDAGYLFTAKGLIHL